MKYKYVIKNVADAYGKTATFMPKPVKGDNGTGMHVNMSIWKDGKPLFRWRQIRGPQPRGAVVHRRHPEACENAERLHQPVYQQLQAPDPGFSKPRFCVRIPPATALAAFAFHGRKARKQSVSKPRFPDPSSNPYLWLCRPADGGSGRDQEQDRSGPRVGQGPVRPAARRVGRHSPRFARPLREALESLAADHDFLLAGDVFTERPDHGLYRPEMGKRSMPMSTRHTRSNTACITAAKRVDLKHKAPALRGLFLCAQMLRQTYFHFQVILYSVARPPSRPIPDCLTPPNGATSVENMPVFTPTTPYSSGLLHAGYAGNVAAVEIAGQSEDRVICHGDGFFFGLEAEQGRDGAEGFFPLRPACLGSRRPEPSAGRNCCPYCAAPPPVSTVPPLASTSSTWLSTLATASSWIKWPKLYLIFQAVANAQRCDSLGQFFLAKMS